MAKVNKAAVADRFFSRFQCAHLKLVTDAS